MSLHKGYCHGCKEQYETDDETDELQEWIDDVTSIEKIIDNVPEHTEVLADLRSLKLKLKTKQQCSCGKIHLTIA